jgi:hypothetical protein
MAKAVAIIIGLVGYNTAIKILALIKMLKIRIEDMSEEEIKDLLNDPRFRKYMR